MGPIIVRFVRVVGATRLALPTKAALARTRKNFYKVWARVFVCSACPPVPHGYVVAEVID